MASITESSVGSLPPAKIAQLEAEMLQARVLPEANVGANVDDRATAGDVDGGTRTTTADDDEEAEIEGGEEIAESAQAYRTPVSSPKIDAPGPPRLESAKSAPPAEMEAMMNSLPAQPAADEMQRASSFHGFEGGDTQPLESQYYRDHLSRGGAHTTPKKDKIVLRVSPDGKVEHTYDTNATEQTPRTLREGDPGYCDLAGAWQDGEIQPEEDSTSELGESVNGGSQPEPPPAYEASFRKPALPATPSLAGLKRKRSGEVPTSEPSARKTPGYAQAFDFRGQASNVMSGTQLFGQTQADSSPMPDAPRSDPALTRPSPNMHNQWPVSSPTLMISSPFQYRVPPSTAGEPRDKYITSKESQERRARFEQDFGRSRSGDNGHEIEEEANTQEQKITRQLQKRALSENAVHTLRSVSARSRPPSRPATSSSPRKAVMIDLRTPATAKKGTDYCSDISDDGLMNEEDAIEGEVLPATDQLPEPGDEHDDERSENDVYDELGQTVVRSVGPEPSDDEDGGDDEDERDGRQDFPHHKGQTDEQDAPQVTLVQGSSQQDRNNLYRKSQSATQRSAIADSQPLREESQKPSLHQTGTAASPSCSYVPGSQYAGKTSQEQASMPARSANGGMGPPSLSANKSQEVGQQVVPSSPPLAGTTGPSLDCTKSASLERRNESQQGRAGVEQAEQEIPESDLPGQEHDTSRPVTAEERPNTESNDAPFSSARSHLSVTRPSLSQRPSVPSPLKVFASQHSKVSSQSPRSKAGVRHFADIIGAPAASAGSGEALDVVDAVMSGLINEEDQQFLQATSSPPLQRPQKRRRAVGKPSVRSSSPVKEQAADELGRTELQEPNDEAGAGLPDDSNRVVTRALRISPNKANEQRAASPTFESTPESVKQREQAGAKAASQLLATRSSKLTKPTKPASTRKRGSKLQQRLSTCEDEVPIKGRYKAKRRSDAENVTPVERQTDEAISEAAADEAGIEKTIIESHEQDGHHEDHGPPTEAADIVAPHRVFALFKGTFNMFYPATWLGASPLGGHRVKFDDNTVTIVEPHLVARMELALGDQIKIDYQGMKNKVWIVIGFGPTLPAEKVKDVLTDIHGHETVQVQAKSRNSVTGPNVAAQGEGQIFHMAIEIVYLPHSMWSTFAKREFQPGTGPSLAPRLATPSTGAHTPVNAETPNSRSRRPAASTTKTSDKRDSLLRTEYAPATRAPNAGVFQGMAFAVSYGQNEGEKVNVTRLIQRNGGVVLDDGFDGLFDAPVLDELEPTSPSRKPARTDQVAGSPVSGLRLSTANRDLGFVALIADKHSRRAKYIQALALGIPTLSGRWIMDSLDTAKNGSLSGTKAGPLPWTKYLLAAGESAYLNGAIRSRDLPKYDVSSAKLHDTVAHRPLLLNGEGVVIVASKKSKAVWERRKAFAFLTVALGAGHVKRVSDLQEARALVVQDPEKWKFVYVDGSVADASAALFGRGGGATGGKKRKRDGPSAAVAAAVPKVDAKAMSATDGRLRVVNDEFVVQSLILGALVD